MDYNDLVGFLKTSFARVGFARAVVAMSGGVDSSTSAALIVRALGRENVYPLLLPYGNLNEGGVADARLVITTLGIPPSNVRAVNIAPIVDSVIVVDPVTDRIRRGNVMARVRMILLYDHAKKRNALVVGTENKTEHLLGYYTRFGDEASDIEPLRNLYKTQVRELARYLGIPDQIISKTPTAGLWEGQTDEAELGFSYEEADAILSMIVDEKKTVADVTAEGFDRRVIEDVIKRMRDHEFKHNLPLLPS